MSKLNIKYMKELLELKNSEDLFIQFVKRSGFPQIDVEIESAIAAVEDAFIYRDVYKSDNDLVDKAKLKLKRVILEKLGMYKNEKNIENYMIFHIDNVSKKTVTYDELREREANHRKYVKAAFMELYALQFNTNLNKEQAINKCISHLHDAMCNDYDRDIYRATDKILKKIKSDGILKDFIYFLEVLDIELTLTDILSLINS